MRKSNRAQCVYWQRLVRYSNIILLEIRMFLNDWQSILTNIKIDDIKE